MAPSDTLLPIEAPRRSSSRRWLIIALLAAVVLASGWTALWFYAVNRAGSEMDAAIAREARKGRVWGCADRAFAGFPLEIRMACRTPSFARPSQGGRLSMQAAALRAKVALFDPDRVVVDVDGPLRFASSKGADGTLSWAGATINLKGPLRFDRAAVELQRPEMTLRPGGEDATTVTARAADASLRVTALDRRSPKDSDQRIQLQIAGLAAPILDAAFGSSEPADVDITAVLSDVDAMAGETLPERLERWRVGGGRLDIRDASLVRGATRLDVSGLVGLDDAHRLSGTLAVGMTGIETLLRNAHIPVRALKVGNLLGGLGLGLGGGRLPDHGGKQPDTQLQLILADGRVMLGPFSLPAILQPLY